MLSLYATITFALLIITSLLTNQIALAAPSSSTSHLDFAARHNPDQDALASRNFYIEPSNELKSLSRHQLRNKRKKTFAPLHRRSLSAEEEQPRKRFYMFGDDYARHALSSTSETIDKITGNDRKVHPKKVDQKGKQAPDQRQGNGEGELETYNRVDGSPLRTVGKFF